MVEFYQIAAALYLAAGLGALLAVVLKRERMERGAALGLGLGAAVQGIGLATLHRVPAAPPVTDLVMALSLVTKLSPARFVGLTMGGWFFATAVGNKFSGFLGGLQSHMEPSWYFLTIAGGVGVVALAVFILLPKLDKAIKKYGA